MDRRPVLRGVARQTSSGAGNIGLALLAILVCLGFLLSGATVLDPCSDCHSGSG